MNPYRRLLTLLLISFAAVTAFIPGLSGGFIFDDRPNIVQNTALHITELKLSDLPFAAYSFQPGQGSRMLPMASFALDYWRSGLNARAFKSTNLLIHVLTTVALGWLLTKLLQRAGWPPQRAVRGAYVLAFLWAVHPIQVSSVLYVVQRMQTLATLFGVLSLIAYLGMREAQIEGRQSRKHGLLALLFSALGLACKEDAVLYPVYALLFELTLLRFEARDPQQTRLLRRGSAIFVVACAAVFFLYFVPKHWHWGVVPGRDFTSIERVMTQARVLVTYLGQMLIPIPSQMPFYYDTFPISKSLFQPWTTVLSIALLGGLAFLAWASRKSFPLFSLGVLWFFAGHALTSSIFNLELAFEHRNHFSLIGILLALAALWRLIWRRIGHTRIQLVAGFSVIALLTGATFTRAYEWGDPIRFANYSLRIAPASPRAWMALGAAYFDRSGGNPRSPYFEKAIEINAIGASRTGSPSMYSNIVIYKTRRGDVTQDDWDRLVGSTYARPMTLQTQFLLEVMLDNVDSGVPLDEAGMVELIDAIAPRGAFSAEQYRRFGAYIHNESSAPEKAFRYLEMAVRRAPAGDLGTERMMTQLQQAGRSEWVDRLRQVPRPPG